MGNQPQNEQMAQDQNQQEQQLLQPWQWRYPPPRLIELPPHQKQQIQALWRNELQDILQMTDFRNHQLPLARIKKVMKSDEEVKMISSDAPVLLAKACEMLIHDLSLRAWLNVEGNNRRTIQRNDISDAIWRTDIYDFLIDIVPREPVHEPNDGLTRTGFHVASNATNVVNNNYIGIPAAVSAANIGTDVPHYYPFLGPRGYELMQGSIASGNNNTDTLGDGRVGAIRVGANNADMNRGLYYPPVAMMDPRFATGHAWPNGFNGDASSSDPPTQRDEADE